MHRVCCVCGIEYGVKPPFDDRVTHGLCPRCLPGELKRIKKEIGALKSIPSGREQKNSAYEAAI
jgi:NMD protein affecting ribosome stability and mRNA decay